MPTRSAVFTPAAAAYDAGDVIEGAKEFAHIGPIGGTIRVLESGLLVAHTAVISGETSYRLHLYNGLPSSALADRDTWDLPAGDRSAYLGYLDLGTPVDIGSSIYVQTIDQNKHFRLLSGSVWAYLVTNGAFTATAAARTATLHTIPIT